MTELSSSSVVENVKIVKILFADQNFSVSLTPFVFLPVVTSMRLQRCDYTVNFYFKFASNFLYGDLCTVSNTKFS